MSTNFKMILCNFLQLEYVNNLPCLSQANPEDKKNYISIKDIYIGTNCEQFILDNKNYLSNEDILETKQTILNFYVELSQQILSRFDVSDDTFRALSFLDPEKAVL